MNTISATPTPRSGLIATAPLFAAALVGNLVMLGLGTLLGAEMTAENAGTLMNVGIVEVTLASLLPLALAAVAYAALAPRFALVARAWTPVVAVITLLSLGGLTGASDLTTAVVLGTMHLIVGSLAAFGLPARLNR